jgi:hypothetical protein
MSMQSVPITTDVCEFETRSWLGVQHDVMKFVIDLRHIGGFLRVLNWEKLKNIKEVN